MKFLSAFILTALLGWVNSPSIFAQSIPSWGTAASFGVFGDNNIINTGSTRITGDVGFKFGYLPRGLDNTTIINGAYYRIGTDKYQGAVSDAYQVYTNLYNEGRGTDLSGKTLGKYINDLTPGTYSFSGDAKISGTLRLNDGGNKLALYIFMVSGNFNMDAAAKVLMKSGGSAPNVFWEVVGQSTVGANASLAGNIIGGFNLYTGTVLGGITMNSGASISGKLVSWGPITLNDNSINSTLDTDGDGVQDSYDDYPNDASRAHNNISSPATIAFEDNWPLKGDYDMNDLVMKYSYNLVTNADNYVVQVISADTLLATGGTRNNAFGIEFPLATGLVGTINSGTQESGQTNAVFMLFKNMRDEMISWNTIPGLPVSAPHIYSVDFRIDGANKVALADFTVDKINPFIVNYQGTSRREVHLAGKQATTLADKGVLGTGDDSSNKNGRTTYVTANGLPWAITLPTASFKYPAETKDISAAYLHFGDWAISSGVNVIDWYNNTTDSAYRNNSFIYTAPAIK